MTEKETITCPELSLNLYEALTGRNAEVIYEFQNLEIFAPKSASPEAGHAKWILNGILKIRTRETK
jgi:hypothetical protein